MGSTTSGIASLNPYRLIKRLIPRKAASNPQHAAAKGLEKKKQPVLNRDAFQSSSLTERPAVIEPGKNGLLTSSKAIVEAPMGIEKRVFGNETLTTKGMSDCSTVVFLTGFDAEKGIYTDRSMIHITGSCLESSCNARMERTGDRVLEWIKDAKQEKGPVKMIMAFGAYHSPFGCEMTLHQDFKEREPLAELKKLCGDNYEEYRVTRFDQSLNVTPDGTATIQ